MEWGDIYATLAHDIILVTKATEITQQEAAKCRKS